MRIINSPPFVTSAITWQEQPEQWSLTIVSKATFLLKPGNAEIAPEPEGINEQDNHWDDDPQKSVYAPSDVVPYKPNPEILLVGNAYAPRGEPVRSLFARVIIGQFDKSIEVYGQRTISIHGALLEGPRWRQMSLRYERAAGGEGSWNPVGVDASIADGSGRRTLPNLQPPAFDQAEQGATIPTVGFGPLAARWPVRQEKLGASKEVFEKNQWMETPLGMDFDGSYFQSAPRDQFVEEIRADETIILENLHPDIERLVTRLPGIKPRTRVEIDGLPPWELMLVPDTLWIDTTRALCTLTFRSQLPLDGRDQSGTIYIGVEYPGEPVRFPETRRNVAMSSGARAKAADELDDFAPTHTNADALDGERVTALPFVPPTPHALPWDHGAKPQPPAPAPLQQKSEDEFGETSVFPAPASNGRMPTWLGTRTNDSPSKSPPPIRANTLRTTAEMPVVKQPMPAGTVNAPPPVGQLLRPNEVPPVHLTQASHRAASLEGTATPFAPRTALPVAPPMSRPGQTIATPMSAPPQVPPNFSATLPGVVAQPVPGVPAPPMATKPPGTTFGQAAVLAAAKTQGSLKSSAPNSSGNAPLTSSEIDRSSVGKPDPRVLVTAAFLGAAEASNAAASNLPEEREDKPILDKPSPIASASHSGRNLLDLIWFDPGLSPRLEQNAEWKRILDGEARSEEKPAIDEDGYVEPDMNRPQKRRPPPPPEKTPEQKAKEEKSRVSKVLSRATSIIDVEHALYSSINDDGVLEPTLGVVTGEMELPFDEVETLKVLTSAAAPLATGDKKLKEMIDLANEAMGTPLGQSPEVAANFSLRIREAWVKANRILASDYLDVHSRRVLLEQRKYQKRELIDAQWIRALLHGVSGDKPIPTYLPAVLSKKLPLFVRFPARLVVEVLPQQDQNETHPIALRVYALARMSTHRPRR